MKILDIIILAGILSLLILATYIIFNIGLIKRFEQGDLNPCYVCEQKYENVICSIRGQNIYWNEEQKQKSDFNITLSEDLLHNAN